MNEPNKCRGGFDNLVKPDDSLVVFDIPNKWLFGSEEYRHTQRKEILKDMIVWAIGADLVEGFEEINDEMFAQMIIPVKLTKHGKQLALKAGEGRVVAWMSGLSEHGIQVKLFAKSESPEQFNVLDFHFRRSKVSDYTKVIVEVGDWDCGIINEWRNSLPEIILDAVQN